MQRVEMITPHGHKVDRLVAAGEATTAADGRFEVRRLKAGPHHAATGCAAQWRAIKSACDGICATSRATSFSQVSI